MQYLPDSHNWDPHEAEGSHTPAQSNAPPRVFHWAVCRSSERVHRPNKNDLRDMINAWPQTNLHYVNYIYTIYKCFEMYITCEYYPHKENSRCDEKPASSPPHPEEGALGPNHHFNVLDKPISSWKQHFSSESNRPLRNHSKVNLNKIISEFLYWPYIQVRPKTSNNPATRRIQPAQKVSIRFTQYIPAFIDKGYFPFYFSYVYTGI